MPPLEEKQWQMSFHHCLFSCTNFGEQLWLMWRPCQAWWVMWTESAPKFCDGWPDIWTVSWDQEYELLKPPALFKAWDIKRNPKGTSCIGSSWMASESSQNVLVPFFLLHFPKWTGNASVACWTPRFSNRIITLSASVTIFYFIDILLRLLDVL